MRRIYDQDHRSYADCFDYDVWLQERQIIHYYGVNEKPKLHLWSDLIGDFYNPIAIYDLNSDNECVIDLTDFIRLGAIGENTIVYVAQEADDEQLTPTGIITIPFAVAGLSNPLRDFIPDNCEIRKNVPVSYFSGLIITPPSVILPSMDQGYPILAEMRSTVPNRFDAWAYNNGVYYSFVHGNLVEILDWATDFNISNDDEQEVIANIQIKPLNQECNYIMLEWTSRSGVTKRHTFERKNVKYSTRDSFTIDNIYNQYDVRKGFEVGFVAALEELTAYDYWYYSDIINSSNVKTFHNDEWRKVEITTKDVTIPNSSNGGLKRLEIQINFAKYDAI